MLLFANASWGNAAWHRGEAANKNLTVDCSRLLQQTRLWSVGVRAALGCCLFFNAGLQSSIQDQNRWGHGVEQTFMSAVLLLEKSASAAEVATSRYTISETALISLFHSHMAQRASSKIKGGPQPPSAAPQPHLSDERCTQQFDRVKLIHPFYPCHPDRPRTTLSLRRGERVGVEGPRR